MTPRIVAPRRARSSFEAWQQDPENTALETRAWWNYLTAPAEIEGFEPELALAHEEYRVLSKAASGGGFLVPTELADQIIAAARAASSVAQVAAEFLTERGETMNVAVDATHGSAAWLAESGGYTPSDETITQQAMGAFKASTKIIVSEELKTDSSFDLDVFLASEFGLRLGALENAAMSTGDGSGKPLGLVHASSGITVVTAATGSTLLYKIADLLAVYKALPAAYRASAVWMIHPDDFGSLAGTADTAGSLALPSLQFSPPSLFGLPVVLNGDLPTPAANAKSLVLADFRRAYGIRRVRQVGMQRQDELHSDAGQIGYKGFSRVDGRVLVADAARILAHSAT